VKPQKLSSTFCQPCFTMKHTAHHFFCFWPCLKHEILQIFSLRFSKSTFFSAFKFDLIVTILNLYPHNHKDFRAGQKISCFKQEQKQKSDEPCVPMLNRADKRLSSISKFHSNFSNRECDIRLGLQLCLSIQLRFDCDYLKPVPAQPWRFQGQGENFHVSNKSRGRKVTNRVFQC
jgi:hypothetical protein